LDRKVEEKHASEKITSFFLDAFKPDFLLLEDFAPDEYLDRVVQYLASSFDYSLIILRGEHKVQKDKLRVISAYRLDKDFADSKAPVFKSSRLASYIAKTRSYYFSPDLLNDDKYEQKSFAELARLRSGDFVELKSGVFVPIFKGHRFYGFLACFKSVKDPSFGTEEIAFLGGRLKTILEQIVNYADALFKKNEAILSEKINASRSMAFVLGNVHIALGNIRFLGHKMERLKEALDNRLELVKMITPKWVNDVTETIGETLEYLDINKPESGVTEDKVYIEDIISVLKESTHSIVLKGKTGDRRVRIIYPDIGKKIGVFGYRKRIGQVFFNLVWNSFEAITGAEIDRPGEIGIDIYEEFNEEKDWIHIVIADNGPGIPPEMLVEDEEGKKKLFQKGKTTKQASGGTGLGLYLCDKIIRMHQGRIDASSEYGKWTKVHVSLPRK